MSEGKKDLQTERRIEATCERVFHAWTDADELVRWFGGRGHRTLEAEVDLREGGRFRLKIQGPDGGINELWGTYVTVEPPEKLVYTWRYRRPDGAESEESLVTVEFREHEGSTHIHLKHERFVSSEEREEHERGWQACFGNLEQHLVSDVAEDAVPDR